MATISIWGKYRGTVEKIDSASNQQEAAYLAGEYQLAYGRDWEVWAGRKDRQETQQREPRRAWGLPR